ncbi:MAG: methylated-DNA--[protein]-cysteine S-methyltransferase [Steroidobacteraceae bacterium]
MHGYALFDTTLGHCGIAWSARGITGVQLPEADARATRRRLSRSRPEAVEGVPPPAVRRVIGQIAALLSGTPAGFDGVELDLDGVPAFDRRVYDLTRAIAPGDTLAYGEIAMQMGEPGAARAVGQALGRNPIPIIIPCHRVLAADHRPGGFSAHGHIATKRRLLEIEGALAATTLPLFRAGAAPREAT